MFVAGPLTQWELIFYGTETPAQEYEVSPESNPVGNGVTLWNANVPDTEEVKQNTIDDDLALVWHDSHAVSDIPILYSRAFFRSTLILILHVAFT